MSISITNTSAGVVLQETDNPDVLIKKLESVSDGVTAVSISTVVNSDNQRKVIVLPLTGLTINGQSFAGTSSALTEKITKEVFINGQPAHVSDSNGDSQVDLSDYYTKTEIESRLSNLITP